MQTERILSEIRQEQRKIASLKGRKKAEYIWGYYKPAMGLLIVFVLIIAGIWGSISKAQERILLSVVVMDADREKQEAFDELERDLETVLKAGSEDERVFLDISATSNEDPEAVMNAVMKLSVAEDHDAVIFNRSQWQRFEGERPFADWEEVLGADYPKYEAYIEGDALLVSESVRWNSGEYVQYEPAYMCVLKKTEHADAVKHLVEYLFSQDI